MSLVVHPNVQIFWHPQEDITIYELAVLMPQAARMVRMTVKEFELLPPPIRRHFQVLYNREDEVSAAWVIKEIQTSPS